MTRGARRFAAWAGIIGPIVFVLIFTLEGFMRPGYEARTMFISELGLGPRGAIQCANFMFLGVLVLVFAWGVARELEGGKASRAHHARHHRRSSPRVGHLRDGSRDEHDVPLGSAN